MSNTNTREAMLSIKQVAEHWGVCPDIVRDLIDQKKLHASKIKGSWRIRKEWVEKYELETMNMPLNEN